MKKKKQTEIPPDARCIFCRKPVINGAFYNEIHGCICDWCGLHPKMTGRPTLPCGQSCTDIGGKWSIDWSQIKLKPMSKLERGDIIPSCSHRVRMKVLKLKRQGPNDTYVLVRPLGFKDARTSLVDHFYGPPDRKVWVERR